MKIKLIKINTYLVLNCTEKSLDVFSLPVSLKSFMSEPFNAAQNLTDPRHLFQEPNKRLFLSAPTLLTRGRETACRSCLLLMQHFNVNAKLIYLSCFL